MSRDHVSGCPDRPLTNTPVIHVAAKMRTWGSHTPNTLLNMSKLFSIRSATTKRSNVNAVATKMSNQP